MSSKAINSFISENLANLIIGNAKLGFLVNQNLRGIETVLLSIDGVIPSLAK